jgi:hypothetical protein
LPPISSGTAALDGLRPNHARRSPPFCFVGSPRTVLAFGPFASLSTNDPGSPNKALQVTASLLGVFPLAIRCPEENGGKKEKTQCT